MATAITSSALGFENIKSSLKDKLKNSTEFTDYDFEASGLSNILDVLAYNTHLNGLIANFSINESFLNTAQLRSSLVSLATGIGYVPDSRTSSRALLRISLNLAGVSGRPSTIDLPKFTRFTSTVNEITYTFQTTEVFTASDDGTGVYVFKTAADSESIPVFEGSRKTKTFLVGEFDETDVYIIPDKNMDTSTVSINVFDSITSTAFTAYQNIIDATSVSENSTIYILKESPNEFYQLTFGANDILGQAPKSGGKIVVDYISTAGPDANTAKALAPIDQVAVNGVNYTLSATTTSVSAGGDFKETAESIRRNAPFQYATQNRMVTAEDYKSIILRNFSSLIDDIFTWGGQDNPEPKFGTVFTSIKFESDVSTQQQTDTKQAIIDLVDQLAVLSFKVEFTDPLDIFLETNIRFQVNPRLTPLSVNALSVSIKGVVNKYFTDNIGKFGKSFRRSNVLSLVDDVSPAVLSSRAEVKVQQRITPTVNAINSFNLTYPTAILDPTDSIEPVVTSTNFVVNGATCRIENRTARTLSDDKVVPASNILRIVEIGTGAIKTNNIGSFDPISGKLDIVAFKPTALSGGDGIIKISVTPANQSAITPELNEILNFDEIASTITPVIVDAQN